MRGARTDLVNMGGDTLLHVAAAFGKYDVVMKVSGIEGVEGGETSKALKEWRGGN